LNGEPVVVRNLGPLPETLVYEAPPAEMVKPEWDGSAWVETYVSPDPSPLLAELEAATSLEEVKAVVRNLIAGVC
jgi:hypothetical protein